MTEAEKIDMIAEAVFEKIKGVKLEVHGTVSGTSLNNYGLVTVWLAAASGTAFALALSEGIKLFEDRRRNKNR